MAQVITVTRKQADKCFADLGETLRGIADKMDSAKVGIEGSENYEFKLDHKYGQIRVALRYCRANEWEVFFDSLYNKKPELDDAGVKALEKWGKEAGFEDIRASESQPGLYVILTVPLKDAKCAAEAFIPKSDSVCKAREAYIKKLDELVK